MSVIGVSLCYIDDTLMSVITVSVIKKRFF